MRSPMDAVVDFRLLAMAPVALRPSMHERRNCLLPFRDKWLRAQKAAAIFLRPPTHPPSSSPAQRPAQPRCRTMAPAAIDFAA